MRYRFLALLLAIGLVSTPPIQAQSDTTFNNMPTPLPGNYVSQGFECCQVDEIGMLVDLGSGGLLFKAKFGMSSWAKASDWVGYATNTGNGFMAPITLNAYDNSLNLLYTMMQNQFVPYRPEADVTCPNGGTAWRDQGGNCWNGMAFAMAFAPVGWVVPQQTVFTLSFNTQTGGYSPTGTPTPLNSTNVGLQSGYGSLEGSYLTTVIAEGNGPLASISSQDYDYAVLGTVTMADPNVVPEPATMSLLATGLAGMAAARRRRKSH